MARTRALRNMTAPSLCALANRKASATAFPKNCVKRKKSQAARAGAAVSKRWNQSTASCCRTVVQPSAAMDRQAARRRCCATGLKNADLPRIRQRAFHRRCSEDRKSVVEGKRVSVRVDIGGRRLIKKKTVPKHDAIKIETQ